LSGRVVRRGRRGVAGARFVDTGADPLNNVTSGAKKKAPERALGKRPRASESALDER
jgi:hypothetical protein